MLNLARFLKTWSLRTNSVTRQVSFNRTKIGGKCQNSNATFWVIFQQCGTGFSWHLPRFSCGKAISYCASSLSSSSSSSPSSSFFFFLTHFFYASLWGKLEKGSISRGREHHQRRHHSRGGQTVCKMNIGNFPGRYLFAVPLISGSALKYIPASCRLMLGNWAEFLIEAKQGT